MNSKRLTAAYSRYSTRSWRPWRGALTLFYVSLDLYSHGILLMFIYIGGHSNTERGYLPLLQQKLTTGLEESGAQDVEVVVSLKDKDPLTIL